jgi:hypothetical protein
VFSDLEQEVIGCGRAAWLYAEILCSIIEAIYAFAGFPFSNEPARMAS